MLVKILGAIDLFAGLVLIFGAYATLPFSFLLILGSILLLKSLLNLLRDFGSWIDFLAGITFLLSIITPVFMIIRVILGAVIIQKGIVSLL